MTAISKPIAPAVLQNQLRPFDVRRDLSDVADLVELCFADTLDMDGREYLARMRSAARDTSLLRMAKGWASVPMTGYVWHEDDRLVGNISLISYMMKSRRFFLIANVAVHPNYRRRGIARHMTEAAVEHARLRSAPAVWLHVREENQPAQELYASLGFKERAMRTTWTGRPGEKLKPTLPPRSRFITPRRAHWPQFSPWLKESYPPELSWHMSFQLNSLRPGLQGVLSRLFQNVYVCEWGVIQDEKMTAFAAWQAANAHTNLLWLAAPEVDAEKPIQALLEHTLTSSPSFRTLTLDYPAHRYDEAIRAAGFSPHQTLVWMERPL